MITGSELRNSAVSSSATSYTLEGTKAAVCFAVWRRIPVRCGNSEQAGSSIRNWPNEWSSYCIFRAHAAEQQQEAATCRLHPLMRQFLCGPALGCRSHTSLGLDARWLCESRQYHHRFICSRLLPPREFSSARIFRTGRTKCGGTYEHDRSNNSRIPFSCHLKSQMNFVGYCFVKADRELASKLKHSLKLMVT